MSTQVSGIGTPNAAAGVRLLLLANPGRPYTALQLAGAAWHDGLSVEQVRTYVVRLRKILTHVGLPASLVTEPGRGYALVFD